MTQQTYRCKVYKKAFERACLRLYYFTMVVQSRLSFQMLLVIFKRVISLFQFNFLRTLQLQKQILKAFQTGDYPLNVHKNKEIKLFAFVFF